MNVVLGDKSRFAAEVGEPGPLCRVDLWAAGKWLTCDDNMAYVPQFRRDVLDTAAWLRSGEGSSLPFAGFSAEATHRRLMRHAGDDESEADYQLRSRFRFLFAPYDPGSYQSPRAVPPSTTVSRRPSQRATGSTVTPCRRTLSSTVEAASFSTREASSSPRST